MKKFIGMLLMAVTGFAVAAETPAIALPATVVNPVVDINPNLAAAIAGGTANQIYLLQNGNSPEIYLTQIGHGNVQNLNLSGDYQSFTASQTGNNNTITFKLITGSDVPGPDNPSVMIQQLGALGNNVVDAQCGGDGTTAATGLSLAAGCSHAQINWKQNGGNNLIQLRAAGANLNSSIDVLGKDNKVLIDSVGDNHSQTISIVGDTNTLNLSQTTVGVASILVNLAGSNNTVTVTQTGTLNHAAEVRSTSINGIISILQQN